jgi:excisionase family DNA binding protein
MTTANANPDRLLDSEQAADFLGVSERLLREMRARRELPCVRVGGRLVRYLESDLIAYVAVQREPARRGPLATGAGKRP